MQNSADIKGYHGEDLIYRTLKKFNFWFKRGKILRNLYIPFNDGENYTEVDIVYITRKGIFVIESKNYSARIIGKPKDEIWVAFYRNREKYNFYNPIKQNQMHIENLSRIVRFNIPFYSTIVFGSKADIRDVEMIGKNNFIISQRKLKRVLKYIWNSHSKVMYQADVNRIYELLLPFTNVSDETKKKHIEYVESIKEKYKDIDVSSEQGYKNEEINEIVYIEQSKEEKRRVCPYCGKGLILRTSKQNKNFGNKFYGCMGYPDCTYTESLEEYNRKRNLEEYLNNADYNFYRKN